MRRFRLFVRENNHIPAVRNRHLSLTCGTLEHDVYRKHKSIQTQRPLSIKRTAGIAMGSTESDDVFTGGSYFGIFQTFNGLTSNLILFTGKIKSLYLM